MLWIRKGYEKVMGHLEPYQLINHFPNESALINKGYLTTILKKYEANRLDRSISMHDFYPETFFLEDPDERWQFKQRQPVIERPDNVWIYKPGGSSRGRGIQILWETQKLIKNGFYPPGAPRDPTRVVQRYLQQPLLLEQRKFDIRLYWLLASIDPLRVLIYPEAKVRLAGAPYESADLDNRVAHLTNYSLQKSNPQFNAQLRYKWLLSELDHYLYREQRTQVPNITESYLMPQIERAIAHVVRAGHAVLSQKMPMKGDCFGLYGADFLVDQQMNVQLTEIQKGPGLRMGDPVEQAILPPMLGEAVHLLLSLREARLQGNPYATPADTGRYRWIINDADQDQQGAGNSERLNGVHPSPDQHSNDQHRSDQNRAKEPA